MNLANTYESRYLLPKEAHINFEPHRKTELSPIEKVGLEAILVEFMRQYELEVQGEACSVDFLRGYTRWNEDNIDILDGCYDTFIFDEYAISCIWMTDNGIPVLECYHLKHPEYDDPWEIVINTDWQSECEFCLFRLF